MATPTPGGPAPRHTGHPALRVTGVSKVYGDTVALDDVSLTVLPGEIHGLLGENGAGKSTLVKVLAGVVRPDTGEIEVAGTRLPRPHDHHDVRAAGLAFIHQDTGLVEDMTVAENVALLNGFPTRGRLIDWKELRRRTSEALELLDLRIDADEPVANLPLASRAGIAIARALAVDASVIVLDEPTASLPSSEADVVFGTLARLRDAGIACVLISHRTSEVLDSCERVTVLRDGRRVAGCETAGLTPDALTELIIGYSPEVIEHAVDRHRVSDAAVPRLHLSDFRSEVLGPIDLDVAPGAIVGVTGLQDGGHLQLAQALFGQAPRSGTCELDGRPWRAGSPRSAIEAGVAMVPADRSRDGLALTLTATENLELNPRGRALSRVRRRREHADAEALLRAYDVRPPDPARTPDTLSGGNAQKLLLAKWLSRDPRLVLLCEPTTGVDVGAKAAIWNAVGDACATGCAALVLSSDFEEVAAVCSTVLVLRGGLPAGVLTGDFTMADIHRLATGAEEPS